MRSLILLTLLCCHVSVSPSNNLPATSTLTLTGIVTNQIGMPLNQCVVQIVGTEKRAKTNRKGFFKIESDKVIGTLMFDHRDYLPVERRFSLALHEFQIALSPALQVREESVIRSATQMSKDMMHATTGYAAPPPHFRSENQPVFNTEDYDVIKENGFLGVRENALSTFSIDTDGASYSNVRRFLKNGNQPPKDAIRIEEMINYFNYTYEEPADGRPFSITEEVAPCPWDEDHLLVHIGLQAKKIDASDLPHSNLIFLIDVSGSMAAANKLPLLKSSFKLLTSQLRPQDRISIVTYAGSNQVVLAGARGDEKERIVQALENLRSGGGTAGAQGIKSAYAIGKEHFIEDGNNRIILATDGDFNIGPSSDGEMVRQIEEARESGIFLSVLGFGMGNYKENKMQKIANHGNGNHHYIDDINEAKKVFVHEFGGSLFTVAKDVKIQVEFNPKEVQSYRLIGYENRMLNSEDFNDDKKDAGEIGAGHTVTALYEIVPVGVENKFEYALDPLRYQKSKDILKAGKPGELMYVKVRYKDPGGSESRLMERAILSEPGHLTSENFSWSAGVAAFGMILRQSDHRGMANMQMALSLLEKGRGSDPFGYRRELISLVESMSLMARK